MKDVTNEFEVNPTRSVQVTPTEPASHCKLYESIAEFPVSDVVVKAVH